MESVPERRLAAVVHADVERYSRLMAADEDAILEQIIPPQLSLLARYKAALRLAGAPE